MTFGSTDEFSASATSERANRLHQPDDRRRYLESADRRRPRHRRGRPLKRITQDLADDYEPSLSTDGGTLAFRSRRAGRFDIFLRNLTTGEETALPQTPADDYPVIAPDGTKVAYSFRQQDGKTPIFVVAASGGTPEQVCGDCGEVEQWTPDGRGILFVTATDPAGTGLLTLRSSPTAGMADTSRLRNFQRARFYRSALGNFQCATESFRARARVDCSGPGLHRLRRERMDSGDRRWRRASLVTSGRILCTFWSDRDGSPCLWAQPLDRMTKRPTGSPVNVEHFHKRSLSWKNLYLYAPDIAVTRDKIVFSLGEHTSHIWMTELPPLNK